MPDDKRNLDEAWKLFYGDGMTLGEIAKKLGCGIYDLSPWLTAPAIRSGLDGAEKWMARFESASADLTASRAEIERLHTELHAIKYEVMGGEDVPGSANAVTLTDIAKEMTRLRAYQGRVCQTCDGHAMVGGFMPDGSFDGQECPDCKSAHSSRAEVERLRGALEKTAPKLAVLEFLIEGASYSYGGDSASEPTPPEFGISWQWQASTPERPSMWEQLVRDATKHFSRVVSEIDDEVEPSAFEKECVAHLSALSEVQS